MGIFDFGEMTYTVMQVRAAAYAGAEYAYQMAESSGTCTTTGISSAVTSATQLTVTATPAPSCSVKACVTSDALVTTSGTTCPSGDPPGTYASVTASANFSPIAPWSGLIFPSKLTATSMIRYQ